jgi:hypothetical protein
MRSIFWTSCSDTIIKCANDPRAVRKSADHLTTGTLDGPGSYGSSVLCACTDRGRTTHPKPCPLTGLDGLMIYYCVRHYPPGSVEDIPSRDKDMTGKCSGVAEAIANESIEAMIEMEMQVPRSGQLELQRQHYQYLAGKGNEGPAHTFLEGLVPNLPHLSSFSPESGDRSVVYVASEKRRPFSLRRA